MTRRTAVDLALLGVGITALVARVVAMALTDLDEGLRDFRVDGPTYVPDWDDAEVEES